MYIGIGPEKGKRVTDADAFSYALECSLIGPDRDEFKRNFNDYIYDGNWFLWADLFRKDLIEWFYSGNWMYKEELR